MNYQPLPIEITQNGGQHYRQAWRDTYAAVYEQRNAFGAFIGYEAIAIKRAEACHAFGKDYPARELYPCNEDWGTLAISVSDFGRAMDAAKEYSRRRKQSLKTRQNGSNASLRRPQKSGSKPLATSRVIVRRKSSFQMLFNSSGMLRKVKDWRAGHDQPESTRRGEKIAHKTSGGEIAYKTKPKIAHKTTENIALILYQPLLLG